MTRKQPLSGLDGDSMESTTLPVYEERDEINNSRSPPTSPCHIHGPSQTPLLEAQVADNHTKASLQALSSALANATAEGACLKCSTEAITHTLTAFLRDIRTAKKSGQWSHDEKKALKTEVKGLGKAMKHDLKDAWRKRQPGNGTRGFGSGVYRKR